MCPVCFVTVSVGLGLSRWLHIDDAITGVWIGAFMISLILITDKWFDKKNFKFKMRDLLTVLVYYATLLIPLWTTNIIGDPRNKLWGVDKLMLGFLMGSILFTGGVAWYDHIKKKNGKPHFPYERVVAPVAPLLIFSIIFYLLTKHW